VGTIVRPELAPVTGTDYCQQGDTVCYCLDRQTERCKVVSGVDEEGHAFSRCACPSSCQRCPDGEAGPDACNQLKCGAANCKWANVEQGDGTVEGRCICPWTCHACDDDCIPQPPPAGPLE
jgi:hypothetical protein